MMKIIKTLKMKIPYFFIILTAAFSAPSNSYGFTGVACVPGDACISTSRGSTAMGQVGVAAALIGISGAISLVAESAVPVAMGVFLSIPFLLTAASLAENDLSRVNPYPKLPSLAVTSSVKSSLDTRKKILTDANAYLETDSAQKLNRTESSVIAH